MLGDEAALLFDFRVEIATAFGIGHIPFAPGTFGSAAALPLVMILAPLGPILYSCVAVATALIAIWAAHAGARRFGLADPRPVVIDEVAGQLVALALVPLSIGSVAAGFLLFRFFDIVKPFPADRMERLRGGYGIVLDDLVAGLYANVVLQAGIRATHWLVSS